MDPFTHTFVGLAAAKAGLERFSPLATTVCMLAANSPDSDILVRFVAGPSDYLHHHRGITHSIMGVISLAIVLPTCLWAVDRLIARVRGTKAITKFRGLLLVSLIVTATHPLMDWTNNYGVRPFLPWSSKWFYGDLVFIVDPIIWLLAGGAAFLATGTGRWKMILWGALALGFMTLSFIVRAPRDPSLSNITFVRLLLVAGIVSLVLIRRLGLVRKRQQRLAVAALVLIVMYWAGLWGAHSVAHRQAQSTAQEVAAQRREEVAKVATMPTLANPMRWLSVVETNRAVYRFPVQVGSATPAAIVDGYQSDAVNVIERFEKPTGRAAELLSGVETDRRVNILLNFARFPMARVQDDGCISQTIVQIADLRYTEPGATNRGSFSLNVPVDCASK